MERIQCFLIEPTPRTERKLRRFCFSSDSKCAGRWGYHNGHTAFGEGTYHYDTDKDGDKTIRWADQVRRLLVPLYARGPVAGLS